MVDCAKVAQRYTSDENKVFSKGVCDATRTVDCSSGAVATAHAAPPRVDPTRTSKLDWSICWMGQEMKETLA